jgi:hypothetical protein
MKIQLEAIRSDDPRPSALLEQGEIVEHQVVLGVDGTSRTFRVYLRANVLAGFDAGLIHGDPLLEELLRFEPRALSTLYHWIGKHRRGSSPSLPLVLVDSADVELDQAKAPTA